MPRALKDFPSIYTTEQRVLSFDFSPTLAAGETLVSAATPVVSPSVSISVVYGADASPSLRLVGSPSIIGMFVAQMIGTLQPGATYDWSATALTSTGQILTVNAHQACVANT